MRKRLRQRGYVLSLGAVDKRRPQSGGKGGLTSADIFETRGLRFNVIGSGRHFFISLKLTVPLANITLKSRVD